MKQTTIAESLKGKLFEAINEVEGKTHYDPQTLIYTFVDGSQAKLLTTFEDCEPFVADCLSTMSKRAIRKWMVV